MRPRLSVSEALITAVPRHPLYVASSPLIALARILPVMFAVLPIAEYCLLPVTMFFTRAQSPTAYTESIFVLILSSTTIAPFSISRPRSETKAVFGLTPRARTTISPLMLPTLVFTPSAFSPPVIASSLAPRTIFIPVFCISFLA